MSSLSLRVKRRSASGASFLALLVPVFSSCVAGDDFDVEFSSEAMDPAVTYDRVDADRRSLEGFEYLLRMSDCTFSTEGAKYKTSTALTGDRLENWGFMAQDMDETAVGTKGAFLGYRAFVTIDSKEGARTLRLDVTEGFVEIPSDSSGAPPEIVGVQVGSGETQALDGTANFTLEAASKKTDQRYRLACLALNRAPALAELRERVAKKRAQLKKMQPVANLTERNCKLAVGENEFVLRRRFIRSYGIVSGLAYDGKYKSIGHIPPLARVNHTNVHNKGQPLAHPFLHEFQIQVKDGAVEVGIYENSRLIEHPTRDVDGTLIRTQVGKATVTEEAFSFSIKGPVSGARFVFSCDAARAGQQ